MEKIKVDNTKFLWIFGIATCLFIIIGLMGAYLGQNAGYNSGYNSGYNQSESDFYNPAVQEKAKNYTTLFNVRNEYNITWIAFDQNCYKTSCEFWANISSEEASNCLYYCVFNGNGGKIGSNATSDAVLEFYCDWFDRISCGYYPKLTMGTTDLMK